MAASFLCSKPHYCVLKTLKIKRKILYFLKSYDRMRTDKIFISLK